MKAVLVLTGVLILLAILLGALIVPCTPPSERADCRKEIGQLRGYLLSQDFFGVSFFSDGFSPRTNETEFLVGNFCDRVNQIVRERMGKEVFRVEHSPSGKGRVLVDKWGTPYNFCSTAERDANQWHALGHAEVSNIVIWSSGPNKINEHGENDDVALRIWPYQHGADNGVREP